MRGDRVLLARHVVAHLFGNVSAKVTRISIFGKGIDYRFYLIFASRCNHIVRRHNRIVGRCNSMLRRCNSIVRGSNGIVKRHNLIARGYVKMAQQYK